MTLEQIKEKLAAMPEEQQSHLAAYLVHLRHSRDPQNQAEWARRIDDRDAAHWLSVDQLKEKWFLFAS